MTYSIRSKPNGSALSFHMDGIASSGLKSTHLRIALAEANKAAEDAQRRAYQQRENQYRAFLKGLD